MSLCDGYDLGGKAFSFFHFSSIFLQNLNKVLLFYLLKLINLICSVHFDKLYRSLEIKFSGALGSLKQHSGCVPDRGNKGLPK